MDLHGRAFSRGACVVLLALLCVIPSLARQAGATLRGSVADERGGLIVGAEITLTGADGEERSAVTAGDGGYAFAGLKPGVYAVRAKARGFAPFERGGLEIAAGRAVSVLDIALAVALERQEVEVASETPLNTSPEGNAGAIVLRGADLDALPDDSEALIAALRALAGPAAGPDGGEVYVDGFSGARLPPKSSIREVRINQNPFSAEFERLGFGRIEIITRPGASSYEGSAHFNFTDESLNARNPFAPGRAPFQARRYGGTLSGPLGSKRASFFLDFERRETDDSAVVNATVLDESLAVVPFSLAVSVPQRRTTLSPRFDYQLNRNHTLVGRYSYAASSTRGAGVGDYSLPSRAYDAAGAQHTVQLTETAILSPRLMNEVRFQFAREVRRLEGEDASPAVVVLDAFSGGGSQVGRARWSESRWELADNVMFASNAHTTRAGVRLRVVRITDRSPQNFGGTFTYAGGLAPLLGDGGEVVLGPDGRPVLVAVTSIERYRRTELFRGLGLTPAQARALGGGAAQFTIAGGDPVVSVGQTDLGAYIQDDWRLRPNLSLSLGLRYENQTNIDSRLNFAPRVSLAWAPGAARAGRPRTVIRAGAGIFYSRFSEGLTLQANRFGGENQAQYVVTDPEVLDRLPPAPTAADVAGFVQPRTLRRVAEDLRAPYSIQSAVSLERQLPFNTSLTLTYLNIRSLHVLRTRNVNAPLPGSGLRPSPEAGNIFSYESSGRFDLNQLSAIASARLNKYVSLSATYGLAVAKSDTDGVNSFPADQYDLSGEYGYSALDLRHRLFLSASLSAPWGIRLSPLVVASSGRPFNVTVGRDANGDALFTERPAFAADLSRPGVVVTPLGAFDPNPLPGQELVPRNFGRGPAFFAVSLRAGRTFRFNFPGGGKPAAAAAPAPAARPAGQAAPNTAPAPADKRYALTLSLQAWNLLNRANLHLPVGNLGSPFFGRSVSTAGSYGAGDPLSGSRVLEMQLRLTF